MLPKPRFGGNCRIEKNDGGKKTVNASFTPVRDFERIPFREENLSGIKESVSFVSATGEIVFVGEIFARDFGISCRDMIGKPIFALQPKERSIEYINALMDAGNNNRIVSFRHFQMVEGQVRCILTNVLSVKCCQGSLKGFQIISKEVHAGNNGGLEFSSQDNPDPAYQGKNMFLAKMTHEIRSPMHAVLGFCDLLNEESLSDNGKGYLDKIKRSSKQLLGFLNNTLDLLKIEAGRVDLLNELFHFKRTVSDVIEMIKDEIDEEHVAFKLRIDESLGEIYWGDAARIRQMFYNVLHNAVKFTEKGYISVEVNKRSKTVDEKGRDVVEFIVRDTGIGIRQEYLNDIFLPYNQGDKLVSRKYGGIGLGLTITKKIAEALEGEVKVYSQEGLGSTFCIRVMLREADENRLTREFIAKN
ncbi:MAG: hypothetical protein HQK54_17040 [Oligoflexales bacterium]|nr:hypothetical protein [Oligoflexales bacterium]